MERVAKGNKQEEEIESAKQCVRIHAHMPTLYHRLIGMGALCARGCNQFGWGGPAALFVVSFSWISDGEGEPDWPMMPFASSASHGKKANTKAPHTLLKSDRINWFFSLLGRLGKLKPPRFAGRGAQKI